MSFFEIFHRSKNQESSENKEFSEGIQEGTLHALEFIVSPRENHGNGYHIHILKRKSGKYVRTNAALTIKDGKAVVFFHNDGAQVDLKEKDISETFKANIKDQLPSSTFKIPPSEWRPVTKDKIIILFNV